MNLRDYQRACHDAILEQFRSKQSTLAVLATGLGKTVIFAHLIKSMQPLRALVLAHRRELIWQARDTIEKVTGHTPQVEMADIRVTPNWFAHMRTVIASIQTMNSGRVLKRMAKFRPEEFGLVIVDEAHHSTADTYTSILKHFKENPNLKILGVTATPDRADEEALGQVFESVAFNYEILDGVTNGWLVDVTQTFYRVESLDLSHVKTTAGDLNGKDLAAVMELEENVQGVCQPTLEVMYGLPKDTLKGIDQSKWGEYLSSLKKVPRRTIVFTASVLHAEAVCNIFNRVVPGLAKWVCGKTPDVDREKILERFHDGRTALVANCGVLTEGFDNPGVEVIIMARPTKSRALYAQMIGRSTRPLPGLVDLYGSPEERKNAIKLSPKPFCRIVDFVGNSGKHRLITPYDILGGKVHEKVIEEAIARALESDNPKMVCKTLTIAEAELERKKREAAEQARLAEEARKAKWVAKVNGYEYEVDPFNRKNQGGYGSGGKSWSGHQLSSKQRAVIRRHGKDPDKMTYDEGRTWIGIWAEREHWYHKKENV
jgi:superfamily II DNA or RNA helicase